LAPTLGQLTLALLLVLLVLDRLLLLVLARLLLLVVLALLLEPGMHWL
jgi:hypothetical protein